MDQRLNKTLIKMILAGLGVSQREFGRQAGISQAAVSRFFNDRTHAAPLTPEVAAEALRSLVTVDRLGNPSPKTPKDMP